MKKPLPWPNGCQGALSLTFDDGLSSQLEIAVPALNEHGLHATFYFCPNGDDWRSNLSSWREVAEAGHEIGNHSLTHPCSCNFTGDPNSRGLENMTLEEVESDILEAQFRLKTAIPYQKHWTFAYPCWQEFVGKGKTRKSYVPIVARYFIAARGLGEWANAPAVCDLHYLWSWSVHRMNGAQLIGLAIRAATQGRWGIMTFHGIHQGHLPVADVDFHELLTFLDRNRENIWTAPVIQVAKRIVEWREEQKSYR